jgi:hypothetical protein
MTTRDFTSDVLAATAFNIQLLAADATTNGNEIDTQGYQSIVFICATGTIADGDYAFSLQSTNTTGQNYLAVPATDIIGTVPAFTLDTDDDQVRRFSYRGDDRFLRIQVTAANTNNGGTVGAYALLGSPDNAPAPANA